MVVEGSSCGSRAPRAYSTWETLGTFLNLLPQFLPLANRGNNNSTSLIGLFGGRRVNAQQRISA